jgi:acetyl esterase/lipase
MRYSLLLAWLLLAIIVAPALTEASEPIAIWPDRPPGAKPTGKANPDRASKDHTPPEADAKLTNDQQSRDGVVYRVRRVDRPELTVHQPPAGQRTGAAVIVCPGGGYNMLAFHKEGTQVAHWLNDMGVTAFVLKYRVPRAKHITHWKPPLMDAQRAIRYVRHNASKWHIDGDRLGILGFSAGGHLAATASTHFDDPAYAPIDEIDQSSPRPDFTILVYPAYLTVENKGKKLSPEITVTDNTPPAFLAHAGNDHHTALGSIRYYEALRAHEAPAAVHVFSTGGHGFGLADQKVEASAWPRLAGDWMKAQGIIDK